MFNPFNKSVRGKIVSYIKGKWCNTKAFTVRFAEKSWKGAAIGALAAMLFTLIVFATYVQTGISVIVDILFIILLIGLIIGVTGYITKRFFKIVKRFNPLFVAAFVCTFVVAGFLPGSFFSKPLILFELICGAIAGFAIAGGIRRAWSVVLVLLVLVGNFFVFYYFVFEGYDNAIPVNDRFWENNRAALPFSDPSQKGAFAVKELFYGSGNDKNRPEYGSKVNIKTKPVDATPFFDQSSGFTNRIRKTFWGFNSKNYPLNARVWYPEGKGLFPLVLIVHGNHMMNDFSDPGYKYLGELLASRGYIVASVDENFLNGGWMGDYNQGEVFTRAWLLLKHLENWRTWNKTKGNVFFGKVDMRNIALIGHSRGGAAVATAAVINKLNKYHLDANQKFNFHFSIKGVVQIAPNDPYNPQNDIPLKLENVNYMFLQGGHDQDMYWMLGNRVYNRVRFTDGNYHFKTVLYVYRANHGQFNTEWGRKDAGMPNSWYLNTKPLMNGDDQRKVAQIYISAFLESTLKGNNNYVGLFKDFRLAGKILPKDYYINQFEDTRFRYIADYQEDFDVNTATANGCTIEGANLKTWSENALPFRDDWGSSQQSCGVYLGWDRKDTLLKGVSAYTIHIGDSTLLNGSKNLVFSVCNNNNDIDTVDFTIELVTPNASVKKALSSFNILPPPLKTKLTKSDFGFRLTKNKPVERVLQYVEVPFDAFAKADEKFDMEKIIAIRFIFDKTTKGEIFLDKVGVN